MHPASSATLVTTLFTLLKVAELEEYEQSVCMDYSRDCERRADLCFTKTSVLDQERNFQVELMHRSCPKTCQVCQAAAAAASPPMATYPALLQAASPKTTRSRRPSKSKCRDIATDCDETADLCDHASFKKMMKKQCAKTCGFCQSGRSSTRTSGGTEGGDVLTISGLAGISETTEGRGKSSSGKGKTKGIDGLSISELVKLIRKAEETTDSTTTCADMAYDCPIKQGLCGNARYSKLMLKMCMRTCNLCNTAAATSAPS